MATATRRSARLAALAVDETKDDTSHALNEGSGITIGRFQLIFDESGGDGDVRIKEEVNTTRAVPNIETIQYPKWRTLGYGHDISNKYVSFQMNLKAHIRRLQAKRQSVNVNRGFSLTIAPVERKLMSKQDLDFVLPYHNSLGSQWNAFATALMNFEEDYNTMFLGFTSVQLPRSVLRMLYPALTTQRVTSLFFQGNNLRRYELLLIANLIEEMPALESLAICRNMLQPSRVPLFSGLLSPGVESKRRQHGYPALGPSHFNVLISVGIV